MTNQPLLIDFLLFDGFSNMVLASGVEPLRAANGLSNKQLYSWRLISLDGGTITSSSGIQIGTERLAEIETSPQRLFVIAGFGARVHLTPATSAALRRAARTGPVLGGIDMGPWLLAGSGLLDGHKATVHWEELDNFAEMFPRVQTVNNRFVIEPNRICAGGATAALELMIALIQSDYGPALSFDVTNMFVYDTEADRRGGRGAVHIGVAERSPQLIRSIDSMRAHIREPLSLDRLSSTAACSPRTLSRLFIRELGVSPGQYYVSIRLSAARRLAEETRMSCGEIAESTGYSSSAALARAYSSHFGTTIRETRSQRFK
ncbi:MAG: GlxA family transcriptional regulator [Alphaproteobacteria bacterium]|nr:GlxA family transcriptional regulator [Alphaproteobacteria bacterium]